MDKGKPGLAVIIAEKLKSKGKPSDEGDSADDGGDSNDMSDGRRAAARKMMDALEAKDVGMFDKALGRFIEICGDDAYNEPDEDDKGDETN